MTIAAIYTTKNPNTEAMARKILADAVVDPSACIMPAFYQPFMGIDASVSAAIRGLKAKGLIEKNGEDGAGRVQYRITGKALDLFHGF